MEALLTSVRSQWDRVAAMAAVAIGVVALLLAWIGVSGQGLPAEQIPYLVSGAILAIFAVGIAATLWLSADLRDEWRKLDEIQETLRSLERSPFRATSELAQMMVSQTALRRPGGNSAENDGLFALRDSGFLPWTLDHLIKLVIANTIAFGLIAGSWFATSGDGSVRQQLPWVAASLASLVLSGAANGLWLLRGRQLIGLQRVMILPVTGSPGKSNGNPIPEHHTTGEGVPESKRLVSASGMQHYHRPSCSHAAGKSCWAAPRTEHEANGLVACGVCEP